MDQPDHHAGGPDAGIRVTVFIDDLPPLPAHEGGEILDRELRALMAFDRERLIGDLVAKITGRIAQRPHHQAGVELARRHQGPLMFSWIGASTVAMKRVPMFMPSAPSAIAATSERASADAAGRDERDRQLLRRARAAG